MDRTGLEFNLSLVSLRNKNSSHCHLEIIHGSGAGLFRTVDSLRRSWIPTMAQPLDTELLKDLRSLGKPPSFDGNDSEYQYFRFSFRIHMSLVCLVSHTLVDKCEVERNPISLKAVKALGDAHLNFCVRMFCSLALITKGSVSNQLRNPMEQRHGEWYTVDTRQTLNIDSRPWCRRSWCLRNPGVHTRKVLNQDWEPGSWTSESGNVLLELRWQMQSSTQWWWTWIGDVFQQCRSSSSFVAMVLLLSKLWSDSDRDIWQCNERRWWPDASRLSQER